MQLTENELVDINGGKIKLVTIVEVVYTLYGLVKYIIKKVKR